LSFVYDLQQISFCQERFKYEVDEFSNQEILADRQEGEMIQTTENLSIEAMLSFVEMRR
jgi:hypothetical protein